MKMPDYIPDYFLAPCGVNCFTCYAHLRKKNTCSGCMVIDNNKPKHCLQCSRKACVTDKGISYCFECNTYPCRKIKNLEKNYYTKYFIDLKANGQKVKDSNISVFMKNERAKWTCMECGGVICQHAKQCSECGKQY